MGQILKSLQANYPDITCSAGEEFCWSPLDNTVTYKISDDSDQVATWSLLHEFAHALLDHKTYTSDLELLLMEVAAWDKASAIGNYHKTQIDPDHIQDCLDTYRDWLYQRSTCPACANNGLQQSSREYLCFNCGLTWQVSSSRFSRPYRQSERKKQTSPSKNTQTTFA